MRPRAVLAQLAIFAVISIVVTFYALFDVIGLSLTDDRYSVTVDLPTAGGIFDGAEVTYRGVKIGSVTEVRLLPDEVRATAEIDDGVDVPADSVANVHNLSALGEQYLDFVSTTGRGPYLQDGSVVRQERTTTPIETAKALFDLERLATSLNPHDIGTISTELADAFTDTGPLLRQLIASGTTLSTVLDDSRESLARLLRNGSTLLRTAADHSGDFAVFSRSLGQLSGTLADTTPAFEKLLAQSPGAVTLLDDVLEENASASAIVLGNLATFGQIQVADIPGWKALLVAVPQFEQAAPTIVDHGRIRAYAVINYHQQVCAYGSKLTSPISRTRTPIYDAYCKNPAPGTLQRGANYAPGAAAIGTSARPTRSGSAQVAGYNPGSGVVVDSQGRSARLGWNGGQQQALGSGSWQAVYLSGAGMG